MALAEPFRLQVALLVRLLPFIAPEKCFALKGGTAINLFVRDLPRLSVDIDLTYVPVSSRPTSLAGIDKAMGRIAARIQKALPEARVTPSLHDGATTKLIVRERGIQVKIEVTPVLRVARSPPKDNPCRRQSKRHSDLRRCRSCRLPTSMRASSSPHWIANTPETFSMFADFWPAKD